MYMPSRSTDTTGKRLLPPESCVLWIVFNLICRLSVPSSPSSLHFFSDNECLTCVLSFTRVSLSISILLFQIKRSVERIKSTPHPDKKSLSGHEKEWNNNMSWEVIFDRRIWAETFTSQERQALSCIRSVCRCSCPDEKTEPKGSTVEQNVEEVRKNISWQTTQKEKSWKRKRKHMQEREDDVGWPHAVTVS